MAYSGVFRPKNPQKYVPGVKRHDSRGELNDADHIRYRSRWELMVMSKLDTHPHVKRWSSEPFAIAYYDPSRPQHPTKLHRYYVDFWIEIQRPGEELERLVVEIKPLKETKLPKKGKRQTKRYVVEALTYARNVAKWAAAEKFASDRGWKFKIWTEKELGL
jgi:hypothetical protein